MKPSFNSPELSTEILPDLPFGGSYVITDSEVEPNPVLPIGDNAQYLGAHRFTKYGPKFDSTGKLFMVSREDFIVLENFANARNLKSWRVTIGNRDHKLVAFATYFEHLNN